MRAFKDILSTVVAYELAMTKEELDNAVETSMTFSPEERVLWVVIQTNMHGCVATKSFIREKTQISERDIKKILSTLSGQNIIETQPCFDGDGLMAGSGYRYLNHSYNSRDHEQRDKIGSG